MSNTLGAVHLRLVDEFALAGYCLLWGDSTHVNTRRQFWTPHTQFLDVALPLPLYLDHQWEHGTPILVGAVTSFGKDERGLLYRAHLREAKQWAYDYVLEFLGAGRLGSSAEASSFTTEPRPGDTVEITSVTFSGMALTPFPSEFRLLSRPSSDLPAQYVSAVLAALALERQNLNN